jgi:hypothetical protein
MTVEHDHLGPSAQSLLRHPAAWVPIIMSLAALATVLFRIALVGSAPEPDEGTAAHVWQILMACQVPVVILFGAKWMPVAPRRAFFVLGLQTAAALAASAPVYLLHW